MLDAQQWIDRLHYVEQPHPAVSEREGGVLAEGVGLSAVLWTGEVDPNLPRGWQLLIRSLART